MAVQGPVFEDLVAQIQQLPVKDQLRLITRLTEQLIAIVQTSSSSATEQEELRSRQIVTNTSSFVMTQRRSVIDILAGAAGHRLFKTEAEVERYLAEERAAWDN